MAIQKINLGTEPLGEGGDTYRSANTKINENFSNTDHAASRLVGTERGNIPEVAKRGIANLGWGSRSCQDVNTEQLTIPAQSLPAGVYSYRDSIDPSDPLYPVRYSVVVQLPYSTGIAQAQIVIGLMTPTVQFKVKRDKSEDYDVMSVYTDKNTTIDANKNIKTSSPVVRVFSDHLDKIHEANQLPIKYTRNGVGDYTIEGTTGLRENDWQIVIPKDDHDNQLIAFTLEDDNGTIHLKTYKRTFSMETFTFGPDLNIPLDIPEGRWVDLHFNDLPQEELDEPDPEVEEEKPSEESK